MSFGDSPLVNPSPVHPSSSNSFNQPPINPSDDSSSPYYLHPSDNPGALLVSEIFNGENYVAWSRSIVIALTVKNKVQFIDGSIVSPSIDQLVKHTAWLRANNLVLSRLMNSISKEIRNSLLFVVSAVDLWTELKVRYLGIPLRPFGMSTLAIGHFQHALVVKWQHALVNFSTFYKSTAIDYVLKFLVGLNDSYASIEANYSCFDGKAINQQRYQPQSFKDKPKKSPTLYSLNMASLMSLLLEVPNQNSNEQQKFCFTPEEFHKLVVLANSLLDTGATDHMICLPFLYHSTPKPINASINLPNGTTVPTTHIGTINRSMEKMIGIALEKKDFTIDSSFITS
ncbi:hypothetical protein AAG906_012577 [Vitis piasezkii]